jgi:hypothetical protein
MSAEYHVPRERPALQLTTPLGAWLHWPPQIADEADDGARDQSVFALIKSVALESTLLG